MTTLSVIGTETSRRHRSLSLLASVRPAPILKLPSELIVSILELALQECSPGGLATVCGVMRNLVNLVIYRTVILDSFQTISLFHRTTSSKANPLSYVKKMAITWNPEHRPQCLSNELQEIVSACSALRSLEIPSLRQTVGIAALAPAIDCEGPTELVIQTFDTCNNHPASCQSLSNSLTRLRICEPCMTWYSPSSILASFGSLPHLSHLQLARRTHSNEDNDQLFIDDIRNLLKVRRSALKMLIITIFNSQPWLPNEVVYDSHIWQLVCTVCNEDERVVLCVGEYGEWIDEWKNVKAFRNEVLPTNFWRNARQRGHSVRATAQ